MELFYIKEWDGRSGTLPEDESGHCVRVLRHRAGDEIKVIDGTGVLYRCVITDDSPRRTAVRCVSVTRDWGALPYFLEMAVCPTKNSERYDWFVEKATEVGVSGIVPVIGEHSERKAVKPERLERIAVAAAKQSQKASIPSIADALSVRDFILSKRESDALRLIACCFEDGTSPRESVMDALKEYFHPSHCGQSDRMSQNGEAEAGRNLQEDGRWPMPRITVLIGPEGDFSKEEVRLAVREGWKPVHLGPSRLRTETAALTAVEAVYLGAMLLSDNHNLRVYTDLED